MCIRDRHKDLAEKNGLKVGDKIKVKSNLFDADNEKGADETVEVEIKGLFDGHNSGGVSAAQELYENTLITDIEDVYKRQIYNKHERVRPKFKCLYKGIGRPVIIDGTISTMLRLSFSFT